MSTPHLRPLRDDEHAAAAAVLGAAFADDPVFAAVLGRSGDVDRITAAFRAELADVPASAVDVAVDDVSGALLGVGLWQPPAASGPLATARTAWGAVRSVGMLGALRSWRHDRAVAHALPDGPAWLLSAIGVSPDARGRGVGGLLLTHRLGRLDDAGLAATLEATTAGSRRLYERHGFVAHARVAGLPGTSSTAMVRPGRT